MKPGALWPVAIVAVLAVTVGANIAVMITARDPNAYVVEPHYYEKAMAWDSTMAVARRSAALGWQVDATLHGWTPGGTPLVVQLADSSGKPVAGAVVKAELVNNLSPEHVLLEALADAGGGRYATTAPLPRTGMWEIRIAAHRGIDTFVADLRREATGGAAK